MLFNLTITPEENEQNVSRLLAERPDLRLEAMPEVAVRLKNTADRQEAESGMLQLTPQRSGTEGFFIALLRKQG